jgi:hypothetical protein
MFRRFDIFCFYYFLLKVGLLHAVINAILVDQEHAAPIAATSFGVLLPHLVVAVAKVLRALVVPRVNGAIRGAGPHSGGGLLDRGLRRSELRGDRLGNHFHLDRRCRRLGGRLGSRLRFRFRLLFRLLLSGFRLLLELRGGFASHLRNRFGFLQLRFLRGDFRRFLLRRFAHNEGRQFLRILLELLGLHRDLSVKGIGELVVQLLVSSLLRLGRPTLLRERHRVRQNHRLAIRIHVLAIDLLRSRHQNLLARLAVAHDELLPSNIGGVEKRELHPGGRLLKLLRRRLLRRGRILLRLGLGLRTLLRLDGRRFNHLEQVSAVELLQRREDGGEFNDDFLRQGLNGFNGFGGGHACLDCLDASYAWCYSVSTTFRWLLSNRSTVSIFILI